MQRTMLDEIFQEYEMQEMETSQFQNELGLQLSQAELYEFGNLFSRLKDLAKKGAGKLRPVIAAAKIASAMLPGATAQNVARYLEGQRNQYRNQPSIIEQNTTGPGR